MSDSQRVLIRNRCIITSLVGGWKVTTAEAFQNWVATSTEQRPDSLYLLELGDVLLAPLDGDPQRLADLKAVAEEVIVPPQRRHIHLVADLQPLDCIRRHDRMLYTEHQRAR
jgi:hypothetical protein